MTKKPYEKPAAEAACLRTKQALLLNSIGTTTATQTNTTLNAEEYAPEEALCPKRRLWEEDPWE